MFKVYFKCKNCNNQWSKDPSGVINNTCIFCGDNGGKGKMVMSTIPPEWWDKDQEEK